MGFYEEAKKKLDFGCKARKMDRYAEAMKESVCDALTEFCRQDDEFAQAVVQGGSFEDCMKAVAKCVKGNALSDLEAWGAAVKFYFPGAGIHCELRIDLCASVDNGATETPKAGPIIDLSDFF
jgi:hypothetical protein